MGNFQGFQLVIALKQSNTQPTFVYTAKNGKGKTQQIEVPSLERLIYKNAMAFYADEECHWVPQTACGR